MTTSLLPSSVFKFIGANMGTIIPDQALENLHLYKYSGVDKYAFMLVMYCKFVIDPIRRSILSRLFLNKFWTKFATLLPRNVAPNTVERLMHFLVIHCLSCFLQITLTGLILVLVNFATLLYYDYQYLGEERHASGPPRWLYFT